MGGSHTNLTVLVVGGGLAGLFCALESVRNGFKTTLLESRSSVQTAGDFITIGPSAIRALSVRPHVAEAIENAAYKPEIYYHKQDGELVAGPMATHPNFGCLISRPALHKILMEALDEESVQIRCDAKVAEYFETDGEGGVDLSNGETIKADMVVAADGIHSKSWTVVSGEEPKTYPSGLAMFRSAFSVAHAESNQSLREKWLVGPTEHKMGFFLGLSSFAIILFGHGTANWVWQHHDDTGTSSESWAATLSSEHALAQLDEEGEWGPDLRALIATTPPKSIVDWKLMWRDMKREWVSPKGRVTQIGDAAHPFLPTSVNGGTQALEDAASLTCCLRLAVEKHGLAAVTDGARVHNALRIDRVGAIQLMGIQRTEKHHKIDFEKVKENPNLVRNEPAQWVTDHDAQRYAEERFEDCLSTLRKGDVFKNTNQPAEYKFEPWSMAEKMGGASER